MKTQMTKQQAIGIWGNGQRTAIALGITRQSVSAWPHELPAWQVDRVVGAALRTGRIEELRALGWGNHIAALFSDHNQNLTAA